MKRNQIAATVGDNDDDNDDDHTMTNTMTNDNANRSITNHLACVRVLEHAAMFPVWPRSSRINE